MIQHLRFIIYDSSFITHDSWIIVYDSRRDPQKLILGWTGSKSEISSSHLVYPAPNFGAPLLCFHRFGPTLEPDDDFAWFRMTYSVKNHQNRSERTRHKRLRAHTLGIRSQRTQDAYKHLHITYIGHILIKNT